MHYYARANMLFYLAAGQIKIKADIGLLKKLILKLEQLNVKLLILIGLVRHVISQSNIKMSAEIIIIKILIRFFYKYELNTSRKNL